MLLTGAMRVSMRRIISRSGVYRRYPYGASVLRACLMRLGNEEEGLRTHGVEAGL